MSPRKMRLVADNIRGRRVDEALNILRFTKNEASEWLEKVLLSAIANWEYKLDGLEKADDYKLFVKTALIDGGSTLKRFRPATHGRAARIHKRTNHITLVVENRIPLERDIEANEVEDESTES